MPPLLPRVTEVEARAKVRALALDIACDIHPLNNLRIMQYLAAPLGIDEEKRNEWSRHWITTGFTAIEQKLTQSGATGDFCFGDSPTIADCCLIPQTFNAMRVKCPTEKFPTIMRIYETAMRLPAFERAAPKNQPDNEA
jgi:maleylpyruvate isomerase